MNIDFGGGEKTWLSSSHRFTLLFPRRFSERAWEEGFLTHGSFSGCAFPRLVPFRREPLRSGIRAAFVTNYSGGSAMDLHHLP